MSDQLRRITDKLQDLLKRHDLLRKENERLRAELLPAKEREMAFMEQIASLEQKILVMKAGTSNLSDTDKKELDKKIHGYLKEIDRCISMLSE
jgi:predicted  nucleic acid-binding Zn-ribbon protein